MGTNTLASKLAIGAASFAIVATGMLAYAAVPLKADAWDGRGDNRYYNNRFDRDDFNRRDRDDFRFNRHDRDDFRFNRHDRDDFRHDRDDNRRDRDDFRFHRH